ncbi:hypothetical protein GQ457_05G032290 [Hibiscus cannabinus]
MELQHFSHQHPLVLVESDKPYCSGCGELISGPSFGCADCGFWLDKVCAEAPAKIDHPFHRKHSLELVVAIFAIKKVANKDALVSLEAKCCACRKWSLDSAYLDLGNGILLHSKCVDLPLEINHFLHTQHSLILQFHTLYLPCQICQKTPRHGICLLLFTLQISLHVDCASPPPIMKGEIHEHPCWTKEVVNLIFYLPTTLSSCSGSQPHSFVMHAVQQGIVLLIFVLNAVLQSIKIAFHCHPSLGFHGIAIGFPIPLSFGDKRLKTWRCKVCPEEVNAEHGVYCCFDCNYIVHANCAQGYDWRFEFDELNDKDEQLQEKSAFVVIKETSKHGEDTAVASEIKHINHQHNLRHVINVINFALIFLSGVQTRGVTTLFIGIVSVYWIQLIGISL